MVALSVASALEDVTVELLDEADLLIDEDVLESLRTKASASTTNGFAKERTHLLHDSAAVHLERELENVALEDLGHRRLLRLASLLEELLDHRSEEHTSELQSQ